MKKFFSGLGLIIGLELRQRVRGVAWYVLIGIFVLLVAIVTLLLWLASASNVFGGNGSGSTGSGGWLYSIIVYFVLLLGTLVTPALSGNAINGERDAGTLATTQVTLITTGQLVLGKFIAAWVSSLVFLVASLPFIAISLVLGNISVATIAVSALILAVELGLLAAIGVALSGIITRPLFSIVTTYLVVAALSVGTLIAFGLLGAVTRTEVTNTYIGIDNPKSDESTGNPIDPVCLPPEVTTYQTSRFDRYWGILAANPYVVLADAVPGGFDSSGNPTNLFSAISSGARAAQKAPASTVTNNYCRDFAAQNGSEGPYGPTPRELHDAAVPSWFVGIGIHLLLAAGALFWAWRRTMTPTRRLARGSRVA